MTKAGRILSAILLIAAGFAACGDDDTGPATTGGDAQGPSGCEDAVTLDDPSTVEGDTREWGHELEGSCALGDAREAIFQVTPAQTGMLDLTLDSSEDLSLYVRSSCADAMAEIGCADLGVENETEVLRVAVTAGQPVWVVVDGFNLDQAGRFTLSTQSRPIACGDSRVEGDEACDPPDNLTCTADCKRPPEVCDDGADNDVDALIDCEDAADCGADAACPIASVCGGAAAINQPTESGDASTGAGLFAGSCTGGALTPEAVLTYAPQSAGALLLTLQSATDQGLYVRASCAEPATELGCLNDEPGDIDETLVVPVDGSGPVTIFVDAADPAEAGPFTLFTSLQPSSEVEPNDTPATASMSSLQPFIGAIYPAGDVDLIEVNLNGASTAITAEIQDFGNGDCASFKVDSFLEVLGADGATSVASNDDAENFCSRVEATGLSAGTYYIRVLAAEDAQKPTFAYRLAIQTN